MGIWLSCTATLYMQTKKRPFPNQVGEGRFKIYTKLILSRAIPYRSDSLAASLSCRRFLSGFVRCLVAYPFGFPRLLELKSYILFNFQIFIRVILKSLFRVCLLVLKYAKFRMYLFLHLGQYICI